MIEDIEIERHWAAYKAGEEYLKLRQTVIEKYDAVTRAMFIDGYRTGQIAAKNRIKEGIEPKAQ
jgi:hypothetical protein